MRAAGIMEYIQTKRTFGLFGKEVAIKGHTGDLIWGFARDFGCEVENEMERS